MKSSATKISAAPCPKCCLIHTHKPANGELADCLRTYIPKMSDDSLDAAVAEEVMGFRVLTQDEMRKEAEDVWKKQPACRSFLMGFEASAGPGEGAVFSQRRAIPNFSGDMDEALEIVAAWQEPGCVGGMMFTGLSWRVMRGPSSWEGRWLPRAIAEFALFLERCEKL